MDEMARHRRAERTQLARMKWGCLVVLALVVVGMALLFIFG
jgi:hypothetical protein